MHTIYTRRDLGSMVLIQFHWWLFTWTVQCTWTQWAIFVKSFAATKRLIGLHHEILPGNIPSEGNLVSLPVTFCTGVQSLRSRKTTFGIKPIDRKYFKSDHLFLDKGTTNEVSTPFLYFWKLIGYFLIGNFKKKIKYLSRAGFRFVFFPVSLLTNLLFKPLTSILILHFLQHFKY